MLRERQAAIWTRFHNLPDAQRYPDSPGEQRVVADRLNRIAATLFDRQEVAVFFIAFSEAERIMASVQLPGCAPVLPTPAKWLSVMEPYFYNSMAGTFLAKEVRWQPGLLHELFMAAALDRVAGPTLLGVETGDLFCPYDGGVDVFVPDLPRRRELRMKFRDWLPEEATGYLSELDEVPVRMPLRTTEEWEAMAAKLGYTKVEPRDPVN
ncbi:MAG TPA: hypothetical protein VF337_06735 [Candidatus Limnocylindrales bacterium]